MGSKNHCRYILVSASDYGEDYIHPYMKSNSFYQEENLSKFKMTLPQIDSYTTDFTDKTALLLSQNLLDYKVDADVHIQYQSYGETKQLPVMYKDKHLKRISLNSDNLVSMPDDTKKLLDLFNAKLKVNKNHIIERLLYYPFHITHPAIRTILQKSLDDNTYQIDQNRLNLLICSYYKQFRAVYYHTTVHYKKDKILQKKM